MSLDEAKQKIAHGEKATVRFKMPETTENITFNDLVRGEITLPSSMVGDFVIIRSEGYPVYNFCVVIDDALMKISHVLRGEEHLSNTLKQIFIYKSLDFTIPQFGHLSVILDENRKKLSKRDHAVSITDFKEQGFLPEAVLNTVTLLGWSHPKAKEILSIDETIKSFSLDRLHSAGAIFDKQKMLWINSQHMKQLTPNQFWEKFQQWEQAKSVSVTDDDTWREQFLKAFINTFKTWHDVTEAIDGLKLHHIHLDNDAKQYVKADEDNKTKLVISCLITSLNAFQDEHYLQATEINDLFKSIQKQTGVKGKPFFIATRIAFTGKIQGCELKELIPLISIKDLKVELNQPRNHYVSGNMECKLDKN